MTGVREVRALARGKAGRARSLSDRYAALFGLAMVCAMLAQPVSSAFQAMAAPPRPEQAGAGLALVVLVLAGLLWAARAIGPVVLSAANATWLLLSPLDRRGVLGRSARTLLLVSLVAGVGLGLAALAVTGAPDHLVWRLVGALVAGVSVSAGGMAIAVLAQTSDPWDLALKAVIAALVAAAAVLMLLADRNVLATLPAPAWSAVPAVLSALLVRQAWSALGRLPARRLLSSSARAGHLANATVSLDPSLLSWMAEDNHWRGARLRSRRWPGLPAVFAPAWQEVLRLARRPGRLAVLAGSTAAPLLLTQATAGTAGPAVAALVLGGGLAAAASAVSGARWDADNPALARLLALPERGVTAARAVLPALLAAAWMSAALILLPGTAGPLLWFAPLAAPALAAAALRMARRAPVNHAMPVLDTGTGAIPTGPLLWALTGLDLALVGCFPMALALVSGFSGVLLAVQAIAGVAVLAAYVSRRRA
ncbi:DUF6297 family protein [Nonomuraea sp. NPDC050790]|uniref:DUF6297 family protein n=1 Tax=Nonomuraea sp. NPDC050790 TaxID=3364371 RepID=UPI0037BA4ACC